LSIWTTTSARAGVGSHPGRIAASRNPAMARLARRALFTIAPLQFPLAWAWLSKM
jgi:hypothetical protein